jgi:hypothetical protein
MSARFFGLVHAVPLGGRFGRAPAQFADRRRSIRQTQEGPDFAIIDGFPVDRALGSHNVEQILGDGGEWREEKNDERECENYRPFGSVDILVINSDGLSL